MYQDAETEGISDLSTIIQLTYGEISIGAQLISLSQGTQSRITPRVCSDNSSFVICYLSGKGWPLVSLVCRECYSIEEKIAKRMLKLLIIKLILSILQHFRSIHLYIKNEYADCKPFLCILEDLSWVSLLRITLFLQQTSILETF